MKNSTHKAELNKNLICPIDEDSFELKILAQMSNVKINSKDEPLGERREEYGLQLALPMMVITRICMQMCGVEQISGW